MMSAQMSDMLEHKGSGPGGDQYVFNVLQALGFIRHMELTSVLRCVGDGWGGRGVGLGWQEWHF